MTLNRKKDLIIETLEQVRVLRVTQREIKVKSIVDSGTISMKQ